MEVVVPIFGSLYDRLRGVLYERLEAPPLSPLLSHGANETRSLVGMGG